MSETSSPEQGSENTPTTAEAGKDTAATAEELPLGGKHALITGATRGIGLAIAEEFCAYGADVTMLGRDPMALGEQAERLGREYDVHVEYMLADVTDCEQVNNAVEWSGNILGGIDILINNAGTARSAPLEQTDDALWQEMLGVNLTGCFNTIRAVVPHMKEKGYGRIVNIASTAGLRGYSYVSAYCAAKHGVIGLTRALAREFAADGITVNALCPGYTDTDMTRKTIANIVEKTGRSAEEALKSLLADNPQGRLITPGEVAEAAVFFALPGSAAITGQALAIAGGEV